MVVAFHVDFYAVCTEKLILPLNARAGFS